MKKLVVGVSGSSGVIYGVRLLELLQVVDDLETHLVMSPHAKQNIEIETRFTAKSVEQLADHVYGFRDQAASISSGSFRVDGMIVAPCSMKTLSAIAHSFSDNLLVRAADVVLKEGRKLVLMPRESPLHVGHCKLLLQAAHPTPRQLSALPRTHQSCQFRRLRRWRRFSLTRRDRASPLPMICRCQSCQKSRKSASISRRHAKL